MTDPDRQLAPTRPAHPAIRWASLGFAALFALSAAVQLNDPDWEPWFALYVAAAFVAGFAPRWRHGWRAAGLLLLVTLGWAALIVSSGLESITLTELFGDLRMKTLNVERWRELGGLGITGAGMAAITWALRPR